MSQDNIGAHQPGSLGLAHWRGFQGHCPNCGTGRMFRGYLKVAERCPRCGEPLHHHRADDLPAYLVMVVVGHIVVGSMLWLEMAYHPSVFVHAALWLPLTIILSFAMLQPTKGAVVALQWQLGMHGFSGALARSTTSHNRQPAHTG